MLLNTQVLKKMSERERHFFLQESRKQIYTVKYLPDAKLDNSLGVILCKPIWGERIRTHLIFSNLARFLSDKGFTVITCDYFGDSNSGGETCDLNYFSMVDDIEILHSYMLRSYDVKGCYLVGLRLGANVAMSVECRLSRINKLVLFEPVKDPKALFKKALRANLATQMAVHKKIIQTREQLIQDLQDDKLVNIDGFVIGKDFWQSFEQISPFIAESTFDKQVVFYSMIPPGKKGSNFSTLSECYKNSSIKNIEQEFDWTGWKSYVATPKLFFEAVDGELKI